MTNKTGYARHRALAASARARALLAITALLLSPALAADGNEQWVGTWSAALHSPEVFRGSPGIRDSATRLSARSSTPASAGTACACACRHSGPAH